MEDSGINIIFTFDTNMKIREFSGKRESNPKMIGDSQKLLRGAAKVIPLFLLNV